MRLLENLRDPKSPLTEQAANVSLLRNFYNSFKNVEDAVKFFKWVYFMESPFSDNPYKGYSHKIKKEKVTEAIYGRDEAPEDKDGILNIYKDFVENALPTFRVHKSALQALDEISSYLSGVDFSLKDNNNRLVFDVNEVTKVLKDVPAMLTAFKALEKTIETEEFVITKTKGNRPTNHFEDPL
jgi:hypothetical protein